MGLSYFTSPAILSFRSEYYETPSCSSSSNIIAVIGGIVYAQPREIQIIGSVMDHAMGLVGQDVSPSSSLSWYEGGMVRKRLGS